MVVTMVTFEAEQSIVDDVVTPHGFDKVTGYSIFTKDQIKKRCDLLIRLEGSNDADEKKVKNSLFD